jgi:hypothetical protein
MAAIVTVSISLIIVITAVIVTKIAYHRDELASPHHPLVAGPMPTRPYLGVFAPGATVSYRPIQNFATQVNQQPQIDLVYSAWNEPFPTGFAIRATQHGAAPFIQIMPRHILFAAIAQGRYDSWLRSYAAQVRSYGEHVALSFAPEMNGWWYTWGWKHTDPKTWIAAWRHVVTVFRLAGATNVTWIWTVNRGVPGRTPNIARYWPGGQYVTWVGIDGYYFRRNATFGKVFDDTIGQIRRLTHKPILLSEAAVGPRAGQARSIPDLFAGIMAHHLIGLIWFDVHQNAGIYHQDWTLHSAAAIAAFRRGVASLQR